VHRLTAIFAEGLKRSGLKVNGTFFDTLAIAGVDAAKVLAGGARPGHQPARVQQARRR